MSLFKSLRKRLKMPLFGVILAAFMAIFSISSTPVMTANVYAEPAEAVAASDETCYDQVGAIGWLICPTTGVLGKAIDSIYDIIEDLITVQPMINNESSPIYQVWQIMRDVTNIVFVIVLLVIIYSQITGIGIANYGIKKALPKLIISAVLVNLSFVICAIAVDASNIIGANLRGIFEGIETNAINSGGLGSAAQVTWTDLASALIGGGTVAGISIGVAGGLGAFLWPVLAAMVCGVLSVLVGLVTIGLRQALVAMLVMIAPLAFVAYLLPNTEQYFKKWKDVLTSMLIFYPMFSLLFGAAQLAGWAIIASSGGAGNLGPFFVVLGMAVQVFPLFLSVSLLKMSSTILGTVSSKLDNLLNRPKTGIRGLADQQRQLAANRRINNSPMPSARLRRYLDGRKALREKDLKNELTTRGANAAIFAERKVAGNRAYRPGEDNQDLVANASTRSAKAAANAALELSYVEKDTKHVLDHYDNYFNKDSVRDRELAQASGKNFLELYRTNIAEEFDSFADQDWIMKEYDKFRKYGEEDYRYKHHIIGAAGALGKEGETSVLGKVISASAKNEATRRSYANLNFSKWGYGKSDARSMIVGYYVDDEGFATTKPDKHGRRQKLTSYYNPETGETEKINERSPGEFLKYHPEYLEQSAYDKFETIVDPSTGRSKRRYYYEAKDQKGDFVGRIYKDDGAAMKEILSNWDMPIADPINGLYGILSGIYESPEAPYGLQGVGLAQFSTTLNRATLSSGFKEKASFAGPMYATSIGQRYIKDFVQLNIARLDNLIKTAKPSGFNTQDSFEFNQLQMLMDPANWEWMLFNEASLRTFQNVNGENLKGTIFKTDKDGNILTDEHGMPKVLRKDIPIEEATFEQLKNTIFNKYLLPAAPKFATMMSRVTNGIIDNQKPGVAENWNKLLDSMESWKKWKEKYPALTDPFAKQQDDTISRARAVSKRIRPDRELNFNRPSKELRERMEKSQANANAGMPNPEDAPYQLTEEDRAVDREFIREEEHAYWSPWAHDLEDSRDHRVRIELLAAEYNYDVRTFIDRSRDYLDDVVVTDSRFDSVIELYEDFIQLHDGDATCTTEDYADALINAIAIYTYEE